MSPPNKYANEPNARQRLINMLRVERSNKSNAASPAKPRPQRQANSRPPSNHSSNRSLASTASMSGSMQSLDLERSLSRSRSPPMPRYSSVPLAGRRSSIEFTRPAQQQQQPAAAANNTAPVDRRAADAKSTSFPVGWSRHLAKRHPWDDANSSANATQRRTTVRSSSAKQQRKQRPVFPTPKPSVRQMPNLFSQWDTDGDGTLDELELLEGVTRMIPISSTLAQRYGGDNKSNDMLIDHVHKIMSEVDVDRDGRLDKAEFGCFVTRLAASLGIALDVFASFLVKEDDDDDGKVGAEYGESVPSNKNKSNGEKDRTWDQVPALFQKWDSDGSGTISRHELSVALRKYIDQDIKITFAEAMTLFDENDGNGDSQLDAEEFSTFLASLSLASAISLREVVHFLTNEADEATKADLAMEGWQMLPMLFDLWDSDKSGEISRSELVNNVGRMIQDIGLSISLAEVYHILDEVDLNKDQSLERMEFGFFLSKFATTAEVSLDEVTYYLMNLHKKDKVQQAKDPDLKGWADMDKLFRKWDANRDGYIDRAELGIGLGLFRDSKQCKLSSLEFVRLMDEVDSNNDGILDPREFSVFLARFASSADIELEELEKYLLEEPPMEKMGSWKLIFSWASFNMAEESLATVKEAEKCPVAMEVRSAARRWASSALQA